MNSVPTSKIMSLDQYYDIHFHKTPFIPESKSLVEPGERADCGVTKHQ